MAPRKPPERQQPVPARLTSEEIDRGITKLKKRIEDVRALGSAAVGWQDQQVDNAEHNIRNTILEVFGQTSPQFDQHGYHRIWKGSLNLNMAPAESQRRFAAGIPDTIAMLENLVSNLEEQQGEHTADPARRAQTTFAGLDLHHRVRSAAEELFGDGHYRNAVLDAALALMNFVKEKSRKHDLDGVGLMRTVFSRHAPVLAFNDLANQSDLDEQEGLMHLFEGAMLALRNPRAHDLAPDDPEYALECIGFLSMLAKKVDSTRRAPTASKA